MWNSFLAFFTKDRLPYDLLEKKEPKATNFIYRDNLNMNKLKPKSSDIYFASSKPESTGEKDDRIHIERRRSRHGSAEEKGMIRVKVTMTKQEAARLLSKCKEGGVLGFKDVAQELVQIPVNRVTVVSTPCASSRAVLKSIPE